MFHATVPCVKSFSLCRLASIVQAYIPSGASRRRKCGLRPNRAYTSKTTSWLSGVVPSKFAEELYNYCFDMV